MTLGLLVLNFTVFHHSRLSQSQSWGGLKLWLWHQFHWSLRKSVWDHSRRFIRETNWHTMRVLALTSSLGLLFFFVVLYQVWQSNRRLHYPALLVSHFLFVVSQGHDSWHFCPASFLQSWWLPVSVGSGCWLDKRSFLVRFSYDRYTKPPTLFTEHWLNFGCCNWKFGHVCKLAGIPLGRKNFLVLLHVVSAPRVGNVTG